MLYRSDVKVPPYVTVSRSITPHRCAGCDHDTNFCMLNSTYDLSSLSPVSPPIMAIDKTSLEQIPTCYATCSIGKPTDPLPEKLFAISSAGFQAIELSFPDLISFASSTLNKEVQPSDYDGLCTAAEEVKKQCDKLGLKILMLQPFANFEGWPEGSSERNDAFERAKGWIRIMGAAGTDMLQVRTLYATPIP